MINFYIIDKWGGSLTMNIKHILIKCTLVSFVRVKIPETMKYAINLVNAIISIYI